MIRRQLRKLGNYICEQDEVVVGKPRLLLTLAMSMREIYAVIYIYEGQP